MTKASALQIEFGRRVCSFVDGAARKTARTNLNTYLDNFSGRHFESTADSDPNRMTANDLVAVTMLSVHVPPDAAHWILADGGDEISDLLLGTGSASLEIWNDDADLSRESPAWALSTLISGQKGVGRTIASKLLAAKRPHLFPIYDSVVGAALGIGDENYWGLWQQLLRDDATLRASVTSLRDEVVGDDHLSVLRVLDIIVWMASRGRL